MALSALKIGINPRISAQIIPYLYHTFHPQIPRLTRQQVTSYLRAHELSGNLMDSGYAVTEFSSNFLRSNNPIEDRRSVAKCTFSSGLLFGVFDGHSGHACAQAVGERLFSYIALTLLQYDSLKFVVDKMDHGQPSKVLEWYRHRHDYVNEYHSAVYRESLKKYAKELIREYELRGPELNVAKALEKASLRLDADISRECFNDAGHNPVNIDMLPVALSGACACVVYIDKKDVYVANVGDCGAVLGSVNEHGVWSVRRLSTEHTAENQSEVERIRGAHPASESQTVICSHRLFGELMPLRAFGDFRYKWDHEQLDKVRVALTNSKVSDITPFHAIPPRDYHTPPYLTASPEVTHCRLSPEDKFIVIASDGLWEMLNSEKVALLVAKHLEGKRAEEKFQATEDCRTLEQINAQLIKRKAGIANRSVDTNVATHLIRYALGNEHRKLSETLSLPDDIVREYRDDITVTTIQLDTHQVILDGAPCVPYEY